MLGYVFMTSRSPPQLSTNNGIEHYENLIVFLFANGRKFSNCCIFVATNICANAWIHGIFQCLYPNLHIKRTLREYLHAYVDISAYALRGVLKAFKRIIIIFFACVFCFPLFFAWVFCFSLFLNVIESKILK